MLFANKVILDEIKDYFIITIGLISYAIAWPLFLMPYQISIGGTTGIASIIYYATGFPIQNTYLIINVFLLLFAFKLIGFKFSIKTTYAVFMLTFLLWLFQELFKDEDGKYDAEKFITYKLDKMKETNEKTSYTIDFYVVNTSDGWTVSSLSNSDIEKLHGIYDYES